MTTGKNKPVSVWPSRMGRIITEGVLPHVIGDRCQGHRCAWMSTIGGLDRIHAQSSDGIDRRLSNVDGYSGHGKSRKGVLVRQIQLSKLPTLVDLNQR
jgi:hypothetical protein